MARSGRATVLGVDVGRSGRTPPGVGIVVEQPRFVATMSARRNLRLLASLSEVADPDEIDPILDEVGLATVKDRRVGGYSLGMRQRLAIGQALMERPRLLLLDEPTNGLDPIGIRDVRELLAARAARGTAIVIASHALTELETLCQTALLIADGRICESIELSDDTTGIRLLVAADDADRVADVAATVISFRPLNARVGGQLDALVEVVVVPEPVPTLVTRLVHAGVAVHGVGELRPTLESRYLGAIGGDNER